MIVLRKVEDLEESDSEVKIVNGKENLLLEDEEEKEEDAKVVIEAMENPFLFSVLFSDVIINDLDSRPLFHQKPRPLPQFDGLQVDAAPFKHCYLQHYGVKVGRKKKILVRPRRRKERKSKLLQPKLVLLMRRPRRAIVFSEKDSTASRGSQS